MKSQTRTLDESKHDCGVILYYHIPGTEGTTLNGWLKRLKDANNAEYISSVEDTSFIDNVEKQLHDIKGWKIVYAHDNSISLDSDESLVEKWRDVVTKQKCRFLATTMFADIIDHSVSQTYKKFKSCNCDPQSFKDRGYDMDDPPYSWRGQLDYFLFNNKDEDVDMDMTDKVKRGVDILGRCFDLVLLNDRDKLIDTILKVTGWSSPGAISEKEYGDLVFTKDLVSKYYKLIARNGDGDFIDAVSRLYTNGLDYLVAHLAVQ